MRKLKEKINIFVVFLGSVLLLLAVSSSSFSQNGSSFDLANLRTASSTLAAAYDRIKLQQAWETILSSGVSLSETILGVVDTEVQTNHPEFSGVNIGRTQIFTKVISNSHGTAVMGIIGANNISATPSANYIFPHMNGVISGATSTYVLGFRNFGGGETDDFGNAMNELIHGQAKIINLSLGLVRQSALTDEQIASGKFIGKAIDDETFNEYANFFNSYFVGNPEALFVVAAGNQNVDVVNHTPGGQANASNTIAVGASSLNARSPCAPGL